MFTLTMLIAVTAIMTLGFASSALLIIASGK